MHDLRNETDDSRTDTPRPAVAIRASILHCVGNPSESEDTGAPVPECVVPECVEYFEDGLLVMRDGRVVEAGEATRLLPRLPAAAVVHERPGKLLVPGFIDTHVHYPQTDVIASHGEQLLTWLERYTFPTEGKFGDPVLAREVADFFLSELLRNGTTTALVFGTVHPESAHAIFAAAQDRGMRIAAGKVLMDRNCPQYLRDTAESGWTQSRELIERWHGRDRLHYAITPRFAPTSTDEQLRRAGELAAEFPGTYIHTHVAENPDEVAWVAKLFPWSRSYLDVYDHFGLLRERAVFAHCLHLDGPDRQRMAESGASMAFCPTSNLFLGSGLFDMDAAKGVRVGLATDVGGGTSFSMLRTLSEAYKVLQLNGQHMTPFQAFYLATLGSATSLYLEDVLGNFAPGKDADFVLLDPCSTPLLARRTAAASDLGDLLFALIMLGDDRAIAETWIMGECAHQVRVA